MKTRFAVPVVALALAGLTACSDSPVAPSASPTVAKPSFVINASPITPVAGQVWVCKVWLGTPGTNPSVTTTANPVRSTLTINAANIPSLGATCVLVASSTASNQDANPTWDEDHIILTETPGAGSHFVSGKVFFSGGAGAPAPESFATTTRNQTFNVFHGAVIVFENELNPPPPSCTFTKGWYRNKGNSTVIAVDGRTVADVQAIFKANPGQPNGVTWGSNNNNLNLYQQLLAALQNLDGNATAGPPAVDAAIAAALAATSGTGKNIIVAPGTDVSGLINTLSSFNEGDFANFPHCDDE
jgi:hypothetical protein